MHRKPAIHPLLLILLALLAVLAAPPARADYNLGVTWLEHVDEVHVNADATHLTSFADRAAQAVAYQTGARPRAAATPPVLRSAYRSRNMPASRNSDAGFLIAGTF